ncbi:MAG: amidohydrolase [Clostridia bacterium]|nr:amidohydrolase [Clostridia bacterium]
MKIRFYNANIIPFNGPCATAALGELWTDGEKIAFVGEPKGRLPDFDREIDCHGNVLLPGFKNAHTHSAMTFLRSLADDKPLQSWLYEDVFPLEKYLSFEDVYTLTRLALLEYVAGGITAVFDMYYHYDAIVKAAIDSGFRLVLCDSTNDFGGSAKQMREDFGRYNSLHPLISYRLGFHAEYTTSLSLMQEIAELANELHSPVYTHNSETVAEVCGCVERYGKTPTELMDSIGMFNYGGGGFHCVHLSEMDMQIFEKRGLYAVTCGGSNVKLSSGIAPLEEFYKRGISVAIGTDGPASNNCLNFFREMFLATGLQKLKNGAASTDANLVLRSACSVGARAMGLSNCDSLTVGKQADLVMIDLHRPNMQPVNNLSKNIVYSGSNENIALTMIAGKTVYERGSFYCNCDPEKLYAEANAIIARIKKSSGR